MIRTARSRKTIAALLTTGLLAVPSIAHNGAPAHASGGMTGLWFAVLPTVPIRVVEIETTCLFSRSTTCLRAGYTATISRSDGTTLGPLAAQVGTNGALTVTLPPPCLHTLGTSACAPVSTTTTVTFSASGANLLATTVTRSLLHPALITPQTELLCRCLPG